MESKNNNSSRGIGFIGALEVALIVLKLCGVINCSWLAVIAPAIIYVVVIIAIVLMLFIVG